DAGYDYGGRWYRHTEPTTGELRTYTAVRLNSAVANLVVYPAGRTHTRIWQDVGISISYGQGFGITSRLAGQTTDSSQGTSAGGTTSSQTIGPFATTYRRWEVGARFRFPAGARIDDFRFAVGAGYRQWTFDIDVPDQAGREVPRAR